ncbi:MAG: hypothetical protein HY815_30285 [Candidatus Riflebacteria bacterium]|nr:hypothetical protein [Candidatus Riflebacteria bacterium]
MGRDRGYSSLIRKRVERPSERGSLEASLHRVRGPANYPVAYWRHPWQSIWLGGKGTVQALARLGFDGVYLDWAEAYDDPQVCAAAPASA